jgi:hypothetical protein
MRSEYNPTGKLAKDGIVLQERKLLFVVKRQKKTVAIVQRFLKLR